MLRRNFSKFTRLVNSINGKTVCDNRPRLNESLIQMLSPYLHQRTFPDARSGASQKILVDLSRHHLQQQNIAIAQPTSPMKDFTKEMIEIPPLIGGSISEHFGNIASSYLEPLLAKVERFLTASKFFDFPVDTAPITAGWTKYSDGTFTPVAEPEGDVLVLDVEIVPSESQFPILATALSNSNWYYWISEEFLRGQKPTKLIPIGGGKLVIGHNASFDRARLQEEYQLDTPSTHSNRFLCTMAMHSAVAGLSSHQRNEYGRQMKMHEAEFECDRTEPEKWVFASAYNSLKDCIKFHLKRDLSKDKLQVLLEGNLQDALSQVRELLQYCANDTLATAELFGVLWPKYRSKCPHPVSLVGILEMGSMMLPTKKSVWTSYIQNSDEQYQKANERISAVLEKLVQQRLQEGVAIGASGIATDPWLSFLDWTVIPETFTIARYKKDGTFAAGGAPRPKGNPFYFNKPAWYKQAYDSKGTLQLTLNSRLTQILLKLTWKQWPVLYSARHGWCYGIPNSQKAASSPNASMTNESTSSASMTSNSTSNASMTSNSTSKDSTSKDSKSKDSTTHESTTIESIANHPTQSKAAMADGFMLDGYPRHTWYRVPHTTAEEGSNVGSMMSKGFFPAYESGILSSSDPDSKEFLRMLMQENISCSFWKSYQERIKEQFTVSVPNANHILQNNDVTTASTNPSTSDKLQLIFPQVCVMGTVTRRAVEKTWMTAAEARPNVIGTELKSRIVAPPGYVMVGADVDSQELWIASVMGDSQFGWHGSTALGWMTLQGNKADATDMHSRTAQILGISRNDAKIFNYGRIYGAGAKSSALLLQRQNPALSPDQAKERVSQLFLQTKGKRVKWEGSFVYQAGTESLMFNELEAEANREQPRTPTLSASISEALLKKNVDHSFITSRVNWVVQSSGVDYLHLLLTSMAYLIDTFGIKARLMLTIHDEVRYLVREEDKWRAALALQISNLWTRCMFAARLGMRDLPLSVAFFSAVDVDKVLRKEPSLTCVTPSSPEPVAPGESIDIYNLLECVQSLGSPSKTSPKRYWNEHQLSEQLGPARTTQHIELLKKQIGPDTRSISTDDASMQSNPINEHLYKK